MGAIVFFCLHFPDGDDSSLCVRVGSGRRNCFCPAEHVRISHPKWNNKRFSLQNPQHQPDNVRKYEKHRTVFSVVFIHMSIYMLLAFRAQMVPKYEPSVSHPPRYRQSTFAGRNPQFFAWRDCIGSWNGKPDSKTSAKIWITKPEKIPHGSFSSASGMFISRKWR